MKNYRPTIKLQAVDLIASIVDLLSVFEEWEKFCEFFPIVWKSEKKENKEWNLKHNKKDDKLSKDKKKQKILKRNKNEWTMDHSFK